MIDGSLTYKHYNKYRLKEDTRQQQLKDDQLPLQNDKQEEEDSGDDDIDDDHHDGGFTDGNEGGAN